MVIGFKNYAFSVVSRDGLIVSVAATTLPPSEAESEIEKAAQRELEEYFSGLRRAFTLPFSASGTEFQQLVWRETLRIPYGETVSYSRLAGRIGKPGAARAVGSALAKNPLLLIIPCHRVTASDGKLTGYAGGIELKKALLSLEQGQKNG